MPAGFSYDGVNSVLGDPAGQVTDAAYLDRVWPRWRGQPSIRHYLPVALG